MKFRNIFLSILIGVAAGILAGLFGLGGGIIVIPALIWFFSVDQHTAQGTSLVTFLGPVSFFSAFYYYKAGYANLSIGIVIALGMLIGALLGAQIALNLNKELMRKVFAVFLLVIAIFTYFKS